jgi:hypothetical protein
MVRLSPNSEWNLSTSICAREHGNSYPKTCGFTRHDAGLLAGGLGAEGLPALPVESIVRKQMDFFAVQCVFPLYPASFSVTASGNTPIAPCGTASFCFLGALQNKFENSGKEHRSNFFRPAPNKALLGTWEHGSTSLISDPSKVGKFKNGDTKCTRTK